MQAYSIDYEYGQATFITNEADPELALAEFYHAAHNCFGIRKSIGKVEIKSQTDSELPAWFNGSGATHYLKHSGGDEILFDATKTDEDGEWVKIKSEWD